MSVCLQTCISDCTYTKAVDGPKKSATMGQGNANCFSTVFYTVTIVVMIIQLVATVEKQVFDFLGYMWAPIIGNFFQIICGILGVFGSHQTKPKFIIVYSTWSLLWLGWNIFVICLYLEVGILNRNRELYILTIGTKTKSWWLEHGIGCKVTNNSWVTNDHESSRPIPPEQFVEGCILEYYYVEVIHAAVQCLLSLIGLVFSCIAIYICTEEEESCLLLEEAGENHRAAKSTCQLSDIVTLNCSTDRVTVVEDMRTIECSTSQHVASSCPQAGNGGEVPYPRTGATPANEVLEFVKMENVPTPQQSRQNTASIHRSTAMNHNYHDNPSYDDFGASSSYLALEGPPSYDTTMRQTMPPLSESYDFDEPRIPNRSSYRNTKERQSTRSSRSKASNKSSKSTRSNKTKSHSRSNDYERRQELPWVHIAPSTGTFDSQSSSQNNFHR